MVGTLKLLIIGIALVLACSGAAYVYIKQISSDQDRTVTTASGATFSVEKGWIVSKYDDRIVVQEPARELTVTLLENTQDSAENAVLTAWKKIQPDFAHKVQDRVTAIAKDGWDELVQFSYATSTQENLFLMAIAQRVDKTWYVFLINGTPGALSRRGAGFGLILSSFKAQGIKKESFAGKRAHILDAEKLQTLLNFVENARIQYDIPGAAIGIVQNSKIICAKGFGIRQLGTHDKVTPDTLFMIGSTTKSLTTFMMAKLVDEGKFTWDTPVTTVMPTFKLVDKELTKKLSMKQLVSANMGMPRQDIEFCFNYDTATPETRMQEMRGMKPTTNPGETFQYSNMMVAAGGYSAGHAAYPDLELGQAYDKAMQSRVFDPLHMNSTTCDFSGPYTYATSHGRTIEDIFVPIAPETWIQSARPAGALWSNVHDMAQYLIVELNKGINAENKRVISEANLLKRREPQIKITDTVSYGLGLAIQDDCGVLSISHGGNTLGFTSDLFFLPEQNVGLTLLTNTRGSNMFAMAVKRKFMELLFDGKDQAQAMISLDIEQQKSIVKNMLSNIDLHPDATWLQKFVGAYAHPTLGRIDIRKVGDIFELDARVWKSALGQQKEADGTLKLITIDAPFAGLDLVPKEDEKGIVTQLILTGSQHKYIFERQ